MTALDPIGGKLVQSLPLDTSRRSKPLASAEKIRHTVPVPGSTDNDADSWRVYLQAQIAAAGGADHNQLFQVIPDSEAALPDAADYTAEKIIFWRGEFYHKASLAGDTFSGEFRSGAAINSSGQTVYGVAPNRTGQWIVNPDDSGNNSTYYIVTYVLTTLEVWVSRAAYEAAKGSAAVINDAFRVTLTTDEDTPRTGFVDVVWEGFTLNPGSTPSEDVDYMRFRGVKAGLPLDAASVGDNVEFSLTRGGAAFLQVSTHDAWEPVELSQVHRLAQELYGDLSDVERLSENTDTRLRDVEDKVADIEFDDQPEWVTAENDVAGGRYPYGGWHWQGAGSRVASYRNKNYANDFLHAPTSSGFNGAGVGLIWVLPNNLNWSRVRLVVRRADGSIRSAITAQSLRNAPAPVLTTFSTLPPNRNPERTVRWSASSDTAPYAVSNIQRTDTITLEVLPDTHAPVWAGELETDSVATALVTLVDDEAAYDAVASPDPNRLYLW